MISTLFVLIKTILLSEKHSIFMFFQLTGTTHRIPTQWEEVNDDKIKICSIEHFSFLQRYQIEIRKQN